MVASTPSPFFCAVKGRCPRCGKGKLFSGLLAIAEKCPECNLSLKAQDSGDGPVFFALIIVGFLSIGFSGFIELKYEPAWWVHLLIFVPVTCVLVLFTMRFFKALLIALQLRVRPDTFNDL